MTAPFSRPGSLLTLVELDYLRPLADIDAAMGRHMAWIELAYREGVLLLSGRKTPRIGGILLFRGPPDEVAPVVASDPLVVEGLAAPRCTGFRASQAAPALGELLA